MFYVFEKLYPIPEHIFGQILCELLHLTSVFQHVLSPSACVSSRYFAAMLNLKY